MIVPALLTLQSPKISAPPAGSATRTAMLDAIRPHAFKRGAAHQKLTVNLIRTDGTAAVVRCAPADEDQAAWSPRFNATGDLSTFFLRKRAGRWRLLGSLNDFHEGGMISVYDLRGLRPFGFPKRLLTGLPDEWPKLLAKGRDLFAFDESNRPTPITPAEADALARARNDPKVRGRDAQIARFRPASA